MRYRMPCSNDAGPGVFRMPVALLRTTAGSTMNTRRQADCGTNPDMIEAPAGPRAPFDPFPAGAFDAPQVREVNRLSDPPLSTLPTRTVSKTLKEAPR